MRPERLRDLLWFILPALLLWVQYPLWWGRGGVLDNRQLQHNIADLNAQNHRLQQRNARLSAEVDDLKHGLAVIEEYARRDLGLIKQHEVFYGVISSVEHSKNN